MNRQEFVEKLQKYDIADGHTVKEMAEITTTYVKLLGKTASLSIVIEEMAELTHELTKILRLDDDPAAKFNPYGVIEEMADVFIALSMALSSVCCYTEVTVDDITAATNIKLDRVEDRIKELEAKNAL